MIMRDNCPVVKCDFFEHKQKHKVYRIRKRIRKQDIMLEKLNNIEKGLDNLKGKL